MDAQRQLIRHVLATLAYRTQKALRGAPEGFADYRADSFSRTPHEILMHMTGVVYYAGSFFDGDKNWPHRTPSLQAEITRFHQTLERVARHLDAGTPPKGTTLERLLQGPLSDAMTHVGQLSFLRRLYGSPVPGENFIRADIDAHNLGPDQPDPVSPDPGFVKPWQEGEVTEW